MDATEQP